MNDSRNTLRFELKPLGPQGVETLVSWAAGEGWNPGLNDAEVFYQTDTEGFYGYFDREELIAGGAVVSYAAQFGFMGLFIVKPAYRGRGLGKKLWSERRDLLLSRLQPGAPIGMDGVVAMQDFYARGGFRMAYRGIRYCRKGEVLSPLKDVHSRGGGLPTEMALYDTTCFGYPRPAFLKSWTNLRGSYTFWIPGKNQAQGFAVMRKTLNGYKIGPLFADSPSIAESLYIQCLSAAPGEDIYLDVPEVNSNATEMVQKFAARYVFECARMYLGNPPPQPLHKIYGITSFELG
jgi:GNAT superfamily N-acetyltransferase